MYSKPTVLIMGSSDDNLSVLLESCKYEYRIISDTEALPFKDLREQVFGAVIVLYNLPCNASENESEIKNTCDRFRRLKIPVIFFAPEDKSAEAVFLGADDVITLPINITVAKRRLKNAAEKAQMALDGSKQQRYFDAMMSETLFAYDFNINNRTINLMYAANGSEQKYRPPMDYVMFSEHPELINCHDYDKTISVFNFDNMSKAFDEGKNRICMQLRILNRQGKWVWVEATVHLVRSGTDGAISGIGYIKVINERKRLEKRAEIDAVSTLFNRATTEEKIQSRLESDYDNCAFFLYDIDNFKMVNDTFGHLEGDRLLHRVSQVFRSNFIDGDVIGRIGGDEFVALYTKAEDRNAVVRKAEDTVCEINSISGEFGWNLDITVSLGVAPASAKRHNFEELYRCADKALYNAKAAGKNCYMICTD